MGKGYLIDSNVVIGYLDNKLPAHGMKLLNPIIDNIPCISIITKIEVLRYNSSDEAYLVLEEFIAESRVYDLNNEIVNHTIRICKSSKIKLPDAIIAATAIVHDLKLVTRNLTDFKKLDSLELLNPWDTSVD
jgi:predicted nucleic acid-binding protein